MDDLDLDLTLDSGKTTGPKKGRRAAAGGTAATRGLSAAADGGPLFGGSPLRARPQTGAEELFLDEGTRAGRLIVTRLIVTRLIVTRLIVPHQL
jgi:hypothetical protein